MSKVKVKTFILALNTLGINPKKTKSYLKDKRLSQAEKAILQSFLDIRDNLISEVIVNLQSLVTTDPVVESQKKLILGIAYNNQTQYQVAQTLMVESLELMEEFAEDIPAQKFIALNNLFIIYRNLKNFKQMEATLKKMHCWGASNDLAKWSLLRADFKYASVTGNFQAAEKCLKLLDKNDKNLSEAQIITHLVDKFDFYVKTDRLDDCEAVLADMKNYRKFQLSSNYNFMKLLLNHYLHGKTLYVTDSDFKDFPMLFQQIKVIQKLEESDKGEAQQHWTKLANSFPEVYGRELGDYLGDKCLFSVCLAKHKKVQASNVLELKRHELPKTKEEALVVLLEKADTPLHQELIYELLWEEVPESKLDLNKLAQLVYAVKSKTGLDIRMKKSCYFIEQAAAKPKKSKAS